jgi:hypothetical protein
LKQETKAESGGKKGKPNQTFYICCFLSFLLPTFFLNLFEAFNVKAGAGIESFFCFCFLFLASSDKCGSVKASKVRVKVAATFAIDRRTEQSDRNKEGSLTK